MLGNSPDPQFLADALLAQIQSQNPNAVSQLAACNGLMDNGQYKACIANALAGNPLTVYSTGPTASGMQTSSNAVGNWLQGTTLGLPNLIILAAAGVAAWYLFKKLEKS